MTAAPRIVVFTPTLSGRDGISCLAREYVDALADAAPGRPIGVWTLAAADRASVRADAPITVHAAQGSRIRFVGKTLAAAATAGPPPLVIVLHLHLLPAALPLARRGAPVVPVLIGVESWRPLPALERLALASAPRMLSISAHTVREFTRANPRLAAPAIRVCRPVTPPLAPPGPAVVPTAPPYALIVGRLAAEERYKGHDLLLDLWPAITARVPGARLVVAGTGDDLPRLRERAAAGSAGPGVLFTGAVTDAELAALYRDAAFVVMPSRHEGFGFVFLEAMAAGRACIGGVGAAEEIIEDGRTGLVVDPSDPGAVAAAVVRLFESPAEAEAMGRAGRDRARDAFGPARLVADLREALAPWLPASREPAC
ncbi:MAG: glycosyltransferase family 4 protein [Vicinamibacterales bacterium]